MSEMVRWAVNLKHFRPSKEELMKAVSCIQTEEKSRLMKFHFRDDFDSSLVGRLLQRKFVNEFGCVPYSDIQFLRDEKGKPFINNELNSKLLFNVSHHGDYTVLGGLVVSKDIQSQPGVGVDLMKIEYSGGKPINEFFRLMNKNFSEVEWKHINKHLLERERLKSFMRHWCLKESYVKNIGVGITIDLRQISFEIIEDELTTSSVVRSTKLRVNDVLLDNWIFEEQLVDQDHCVAIALSNIEDIPHQSFDSLTIKQLLENSMNISDLDEQYYNLVTTKPYKKH